MKIQNKHFESLNLPEIGIVNFTDGIAEVDDKFSEICERLQDDKIIKIVILENSTEIEIATQLKVENKEEDLLSIENKEEDLLSIENLNKLTHEELIEIGQTYIENETFEKVKTNKKALIANILKKTKK